MYFGKTTLYMNCMDEQEQNPHNKTSNIMHVLLTHIQFRLCADIFFRNCNIQPKWQKLNKFLKKSRTKRCNYCNNLVDKMFYVNICNLLRLFHNLFMAHISVFFPEIFNGSIKFIIFRI